MAEKTMYLEILTPEKSLFSGFVRAFYFPGEGGCLGILPGHALLLTRLGVGVATAISENNEELRFFCAGGFAEVNQREIFLLATVAERAEDVDPDRAARARERAEKRVFSGSAAVDYARAVACLERSLDRLRIARR